MCKDERYKICYDKKANWEIKADMSSSSSSESESEPVVRASAAEISSGCTRCQGPKINDNKLDLYCVRVWDCWLGRKRTLCRS